MGNFNPQLPTKYLGTNKYITFFVSRNREPTLADYRQPETGTLYSVGTIWQVSKDPTTGVEGDIYILSKIVANQGYWIIIAGSIVPILEVDADSGTAIPIFGLLVLSGGSTGLTTIASGNEVDLTGTLNVSNGGTGQTSFVAHSVLLGNGISSLNARAPSIVAGIPLVSQGSSADPNFTTAVVAGGGTGQTSFTTFSPIISGTTVSGAFQTATGGTGIAGEAFVSSGAGVKPAWGVLPVLGGGTGQQSLGAYSVLCGGNTSTGAINYVSSLGTAGQVLTSSGAFALPTWSNNVAIQLVNVIVLSNPGSGTYTAPANLVGIVIQAIGAGGGGGGADATNGSVASGSGASAGDYVIGNYPAATIGASQSYIIGTAGTGASAGNNNGTAGGATVFGSLITAAGGNFGFGSPSSDTTCIGGGLGAGTSSGGAFTTAGQGGGSSFGVKSGSTAAAFGGFGGSSFFGGGGTSHGGSTVTTFSTTGNAGTGIGAGGGGGVSVSFTGSSASAAGGGGGNGGLIIYEFIS